MDARRIRRIVRNLLGNAIEHGEGKPITVTIDSNATAVAIAVRDHGIGMTRADADRVFDRFWRADPSRQRTTGGTGLGLAISLEDATLHAGWLNVWSAEGRGSCFRLTLPRSPRAPIESSPLAAPARRCAALVRRTRDERPPIDLDPLRLAVPEDAPVWSPWWARARRSDRAVGLRHHPADRLVQAGNRTDADDRRPPSSVRADPTDGAAATEIVERLHRGRHRPAGQLQGRPPVPERRVRA